MSYEEGCSASSGYEMDTSYGCDAYDSYYNPPDSPAVCDAYDSYYNPPDSPAVCTSSDGYYNSSNHSSVWTTSGRHYNRSIARAGYSGDEECGSAKNIFVIFITIVCFMILIGTVIWYYTT